MWLAKEGHDGVVGINYLEKVQAPTLPSLYGAMLAGVDYVLMGAGIPKAIPAILNRLADGLPVKMKLDVKGATGDGFFAEFDPVEAMGGSLPPVTRPKFLAIITSHILATMLGTKIEVPVDGFVVEGATAGGHNAPPRGKLQVSDIGEPIYGDRDVPDLEAIHAIGLPFWLAGGYADPERVAEALTTGAVGVQIGTAFAYCDESGTEAEIKKQVLKLSADGQVKVFTDPVASPSGFPFKVIPIEGSQSEQDVYEKRVRVCELGYLRSAYQRDDGKMGWRCASEPVQVFLRKGGTEEAAAGRKCLCSALMSNVGLGQLQPDGTIDPMLITSGDDIADVARFIAPGAMSYSAADVIRQVLPTE